MALTCGHTAGRLDWCLVDTLDWLCSLKGRERERFLGGETIPLGGERETARRLVAGLVT